MSEQSQYGAIEAVAMTRIPTDDEQEGAGEPLLSL